MSPLFWKKSSPWELVGTVCREGRRQLWWPTGAEVVWGSLLTLQQHQFSSLLSRFLSWSISCRNPPAEDLTPFTVATTHCLVQPDQSPDSQCSWFSSSPLGCSLATCWFPPSLWIIFPSAPFHVASYLSKRSLFSKLITTGDHTKRLCGNEYYANILIRQLNSDTMATVQISRNNMPQSNKFIGLTQSYNTSGKAHQRFRSFIVL